MDEPQRYESQKRFASVTGFILDVAILVYLVSSGLSIRLREFAEGISTSPWLSIAIYFIGLGVIFNVFNLALSFYSGYILEHRFGLSRQSLADWVKDQLKGIALSIPLGIAGVEIVYGFLRISPANWWVYASVVFIMFVVVMTNLAPVLLLPLFFKFRPVENQDLQKRVDRVARRTNTAVCGIFEWALGEKTRKANAAVVGWGNTRRIIVSDTLIENFSGEEIEVIMAHELCHHVKNHIWQSLALQSALTFGGFYVAHRLMPALSLHFGFRSIADAANFPLLALVMSGVSLLILPLVNSFSRRLETEADLYALDITGDALAFVSSMEKLAEINLANKTPNKIIEFIFYSHPCVEDRIQLAANRVGQNVS
ncbi:MAG TPA: M48 family metallopeptidase [Terriglobia bacterium]|jgi:STE24 endopeptidase